MLWEQAAPGWAWVLLAVHALAWPQLALLAARLSRQPARQERRNLLLDCAMGGFWVLVMAGNALPTALIVSTLAAAALVLGGGRMLLLALGTLAAVVLAGGSLMAPHASLTPSAMVLAACLPLLVAAPLMIAFMAAQLSRRMQTQQRRLDALEQIDALTGLANRNGFEAAAWLELRRHQSGGPCASLLRLQIDRLQQLPGLIGQGSVETALRRVAELLRRKLRDIDTAAHLGGGEFVVVLAGTSIGDSEQIGRRLRDAIAAQVFEDWPRLQLSASMGCTALTAGRQDSDSLQSIQHALQRCGSYG